MSDRSPSEPKPERTTQRFLFVTADRFPPFRVDVSVLFGKELRARGHTIDWVMQAENEDLIEAGVGGAVDWDGWKVHVSKVNHGSGIAHRLHKHFLGLLNDLKSWRLTRRGNYDFVQIKDKFLIAPIVVLAARLSKTPVVYWLSYPFQDSSIFAADVGTARYPLLYRIRGHFFRFVLYKVVAPNALHIVVQSEQMKRDLVAEGIPDEKMTAVPMGVEMSADDRPAPCPIVSGQMIYVGTLLKTRRMDFLVRVLALVKKERPDATLLMVGPEELPGDEQVLRDEAERLGVSDALVITGRLERDRAFQHVRESEVCFSPFFPTPILNSTSPTKLVEYMSQARPMVANDHPEQRLLIDESGAGFCVAYDEQAFADAALRLMADADEANAMGERGYNWVVANRSYTRLADDLEATYKEILANDLGCSAS